MMRKFLPIPGSKTSIYGYDFQSQFLKFLIPLLVRVPLRLTSARGRTAYNS